MRKQNVTVAIIVEDRACASICPFLVSPDGGDTYWYCRLFDTNLKPTGRRTADGTVVQERCGYCLVEDSV